MSPIVNRAYYHLSVSATVPSINQHGDSMKRVLKVVGGLAAVLIVLVLAFSVYVLAVWDHLNDRPAPEMTAHHDSAAIARGEYLFKVTWQCFGCHQSGAPDADAPPSGGQAFDLRSTGPGFGIYYSRNITPDSATGIGTWTDGQIVQAIREGVNRDRRTLFPIMPVDWLKGLSDEDALALAAYLRSIPPVHNEVPRREPTFFAKVLLALNVIKPTPPIVRPIVAPPRGATIEYGRYMATAASGCADCHTPRNLQNGQFYIDSLFAGGSIAFGEPEHGPVISYARNLRPDPTDEFGRWTEEQFIVAVTAGLRRDSTALVPQMPYAQYKFLAPDDLRAIYLYLQSFPPVRRTTPPVRYSSALESAQGSQRGKMLFEARCQSCHGEKGMGIRVTSVRLAEAVPLYTDEDLRNFVQEGQIDLKMPAFRKTLSRKDLDDIVAYIRSWRSR
jgi:mono/diheme cytochrome c family protein